MSARGRGAEYRPRAAYYTPDPLARALLDVTPMVPGASILEPHGGGGAFVRAARAAGAHVTAMDIDPEAPGLALAHRAIVGDFLSPAKHGEYDGIVGNPPYGPAPGVAEVHIRRALEVVRPQGWVAYLLRLSMLASAERLDLWREHPPLEVHVLAQRPSFTGAGTDATDYGFFLWRRGCRGLAPIVRWVDWRSGARTRPARSKGDGASQG